MCIVSLLLVCSKHCLSYFEIYNVLLLTTPFEVCWEHQNLFGNCQDGFRIWSWEGHQTQCCYLTLPKGIANFLTISGQEPITKVLKGQPQKQHTALCEVGRQGCWFLYASISKSWLPSPWKRQCWVVKLTRGREQDLHLKVAEKEFAITSLLK